MSTGAAWGEANGASPSIARTEFVLGTAVIDGIAVTVGEKLGETFCCDTLEARLVGVSEGDIVGESLGWLLGLSEGDVEG